MKYCRSAHAFLALIYCVVSYSLFRSRTQSVQHDQSSLIFKARGQTIKEELVSVCIPVYNGSDFVSDALRSALNQTHGHLEVLVSLDLSADSLLSETALHAVLQSPPTEERVQIFYQKERLGWIDNTNFLLSRAGGAYVMVLPHDDVIPPNYVEMLLACMHEHPEAVNCYPRCCVANTRRDLHLCSRVIRQPNVTGTLEERVYKSMQHSAGVSFRGLVRRQRLRDFKPFLLQSIHKNHWSADLLQITQFALFGTLLEVNVPYYKFFHRKSIIASRFSPNDTLLAYIDRMGGSYLKANMHMQSSDALRMYCETLLFTYLEQHAGVHHSKAMVLTLFYERIHRTKQVAVLGGGIQGCMAALVFAKRGLDVRIYDQAEDIMQRASSNQEGKIHLGFVYSMDPSMETARYMLTSSLWFSRYVEHLVGHNIDWSLLKSSPFRYLVPYTSLVKPAALEEFFEHLQLIYTRMISKDLALTYLGERPKRLFKRAAVPREVNQSYFAAAYDTEEYAIHQSLFHRIIRNALEQHSVKFIFNTTVTGVRRLLNSPTGRFSISKIGGDHIVDIVANCLWDGRMAIDAQLGVPPWSGNNVRLKLGIKTGYTLQLANMMSTTIVNGPFGDFVNFDNQRRMYFSWYPVSMQGMVVNMKNNALPPDWQHYMAGAIPTNFSTKLIKLHEDQFARIFTVGKIQFQSPKLVAGVIVGNGDKDVQHLDSGLHKRADAPIMHQDGYFSISTQKFTSAPYNAYLLQRMLSALASPPVPHATNNLQLS
ncbi:MAG: hypothetical protein J3K34DRAFT_450100 [Monoraphidium minutum]|nr:MAG: hypothetical protein J3K34DRAFT_450100 [Monoraphidium minutum]